MSQGIQARTGKTHWTSSESSHGNMARLTGQVVDALETIVVGKRDQVSTALACILAGGHLLIEDFPGVGKTTLGQALAKVLDLSYQRVQFTSDLLPADIIGVSIYRRESDQFEFHRGPIFAQLVLADEVNRATPKAQSALLEAMEEQQVTTDGQTHPLPQPFFVVATRNPADQIGTFPLPESQLDRFLLQISLGYPNAADERQLLKSGDRRVMIGALEPVLSIDDLMRLQAAVPAIHVSEPLLDYLQALVDYSRNSGHFTMGLSPRGAIALLRCAQAWALMRGHQGVHPDDLQAVLPSVVAHRLEFSQGQEQSSANIGQMILDAVSIP
jgi:MoxR-like ATPase